MPHPLYHLTLAVSAANQPEDIFEAALDCLAQSLNVCRSSVLLFDADGIMRFRAWRDLSPEYRAAVDGHSPWTPGTTDAQPVLVPDVREDASLVSLMPVFESEQIGALAFVPLAIGERLLGKFMLYYDAPHTFTHDEMLTAQTIAAHVALAIDQQQHRESEQQYRALIDAVGIAMYTTDIEGRITFYNEEAAQFWGRRPEIGKDLWCGSWRLYWPDGRPMNHDECPMATTLKERRPVRNAEAIAERPDGTRVSFVPYPSPLLDAHGNFIGAMNLLVDITDRKIAEQALESAVEKQEEALALNLETEARLMMLVEASSRLIESLSPEDTLPAILGVARKVLTADAFAVWSPVATGDWRVLTAEGLSLEYLNEHGTASWGDAEPPAAPTLVVEDVAREPMLADRLAGYEREGIRSLLVVPLAFAGRPAGTLTFYYRQRHMFAEAEVRVATALASLAAAAIGHAEMRELERSSRELTQQLNHRLAFLLKVSAELSASLDVDEILERTARLCVPELGDWCVVNMLDEGEVRTAAIAHTDPERVEFARALSERYPRSLGSARSAHGWARVMHTGQPELIEEITDDILREVALDDERLDIARGLNIRSSLVVPLVGRDRILGAITFIAAGHHVPFTVADVPFAEDVARRAVVAIENARLYRESETAAELLRIANAAKDEFLSLVSHELKTPLTTIRGNAGVLYRSGDRIDTASRQAALADMVNEGERLYRIIENLLLLARAEQGQLTDIEPLLLIRMVERVIERHRQRNIGRRYEVVEHGDTQPVLFSEACLEQVLENLISNAEKYSPVSEPIVVEIDRKPTEVTLRVLDRGVGISVSEAAEIFEPFFRAKHASEHAEGLGIGLAVCKRLVEAQGGRIWAEPRDEGGSEFGFILPVADEDLDV